jgi:hypothetical protein
MLFTSTRSSPSKNAWSKAFEAAWTFMAYCWAFTSMPLRPLPWVWTMKLSSLTSPPRMNSRSVVGLSVPVDSV